MAFEAPQSAVFAGVSSLTDGGILLGNGSGVIIATAALTDGQVAIGVSSADPVLEQFAPPGQVMNMGLASVTTTNANDSVKISGSTAALSATNPLFVAIYSSATPGLTTILKATADITFNLTGAHWGIGTTGDIANGFLRVFAINDNGTLKWGIGYQGGRVAIADTGAFTTATSVTLPEHLLVNSALTAGTWPMVEVGFFRANFDDTGGAAEDLWAVSTSLLIAGTKADGFWQPWNPVFGGYSANPTITTARWMSIGSETHIVYKQNATGTSNATTTTITLPIKAKQVQGAFLYQVVNNGAATTGGTGVCETTAGSTTLNCYLNPSLGAWTNVNAKGFSVASLIYEQN